MGRKLKPHRSRPTRVAIAEELFEEALPLRWVMYPSHYGAFFAFADRPEGPFTLCECARVSVQNAIRLTNLDGRSYSDRRRLAPLSDAYFPDSLSERSLLESDNPLKWLRFEPRVCHRCNLATPVLRYCHEMYGGQFLQKFGWYVNQTFLRLGLRPGDLDYLEDSCPSKLAQKVLVWREVEREHQAERARLLALAEGPARSEISPDEPTYWRNVRMGEEDRFVALRREAGRLRQAVLNDVESTTRQDFGFRAVGDGWISESILFNVVRRLLPDDTILRHHRPDWLEGLELDIFIPARMLGIEYQGQQHFHSVSVWGGDTALKSQQQRDARKAELCAGHGVRLITVDYTEPLDETHVAERLRVARRDALVSFPSG